MQLSGGRRAQAILLISLALGGGLNVGCERPPEPRGFEDFAGAVSSVDAERGEMFVQLDALPARPRGWIRPVVYKLTAESELFINDMARPLADVRSGDRVEVLGVRDEEEPNWVIVSVAYLKRDAPPPEPPELRQPE